MKSKIILGVISLLLVLPLTGQALTIDGVMLNYINYLKERISVLEAENAELREDKKLGTHVITKRKVVKEDKPTLATVTAIPIGQDDEGYNLDLKVEGIFDTAYVIVKNPDNYEIATIHMKKSQAINFNALTKGTYTYTVKATRGSDTSFLSGEFAI